MEGAALSEDDDAEIVSFVKNMHGAGWVHRDPHPANFIRTDQGVATIDPIKVRQTRSPYLRAYDVVLMEHDMPNATELYGRSELHGWYHLARIGHGLLCGYRLVKHALQRLLGIAGIR
jgi:serine/threonine protein kinase